MLRFFLTLEIRDNSYLFRRFLHEIWDNSHLFRYFFYLQYGTIAICLDTWHLKGKFKFKQMHASSKCSSRLCTKIHGQLPPPNKLILPSHHKQRRTHRTYCLLHIGKSIAINLRKKLMSKQIVSTTLNINTITHLINNVLAFKNTYKPHNVIKAVSKY